VNLRMISLPLLAMLAAVPADASADDADPAALRIDPLLRDGPTRAAPDTVLRAIVRLPGASAQVRGELERRGLAFRRSRDGRVRRLGDLHLVEGPARALAEEASRGTEVRVSRPLGIHPTDYGTSREVQNYDLLGAAPTPTQGPLGRRVTVGLVDTGIDIHHPHFFRADGGAFPWIDVDGDGAFRVGVDALDISLDGEVQPLEALELIDLGVAQPNQLGAPPDWANGTFEPAFDYLFLDLDGNGRRDAGRDAGYGESSPGFGEPVFMPDDANGDGVLATDERLILLGTSQVKAVRVAGEVYTRGDNLIDLPVSVSRSEWAFHGTGTAGIITGGQTHPFRFNRADVPDADIVMVAYPEYTVETDDAWLFEGMTWLVEDMQASVVNHSWSQDEAALHMDGSNTTDLTMDAASAAGSVQVCSAGNRRAVGKHAQATAAGGPVDFEATLPQTVAGVTPSTLTFDLYWGDPSVALACSVTKPNGSTHAIEELPAVPFDGSLVSAVRSVSERGWVLLSIRIEAEVSGHVGQGEWALSCAQDGASDLEVHALVSDGISVYEGARFTQPSEISTSVSPAISDGCIGVSGYTVQYPAYYDSVLGELESYSSFGPRYDGAVSIDLAAPVDSIAPTNATYGGSYVVFWGTSGASPQVAAAAALMRSLQPELTSAEILTQLQQSAETAGLDVEDGPDNGWGFGKLRAYPALLGEEPPPRPEVESIAIAVEYAPDGEGCAATLYVEGADWEQPSVRWDDDYDGTWDTDFEELSARTITLAPGETELHVRVDAGQRGFIVAGATLDDTAPEECFEAPPVGTTGTEEPMADDSGGADTLGDTTDGTAGADADGSGGCGCRSDGAQRSALPLIVLVALRRRRARLDHVRPASTRRG
jgi:subtilisin family serine protease